MNAYLVTDSEDVYVIVAADTRRQALRMYPTEYAEHVRLLERDAEWAAGDITADYLRSRGVDLILSGVIQPNWRCAELGAGYDDYRGWRGFTGEEADS